MIIYAAGAAAMMAGWLGCRNTIFTTAADGRTSRTHSGTWGCKYQDGELADTDMSAFLNCIP
jgi:hypothetical protein